MSHKGNPILGDKTYGKKINSEFLNKLLLLNGQALHAKSLSFVHPSENKWVHFKSELPEDFKNLLNFLDNLCG